MKIKDNYLTMPIKDRRTIVVSDIHGALDLFKALLDKVNYVDEDRLIILGDIMDKGPNGIELVEFIAQLLKKDNVFMVLGNCDCIFDELEEDYLYDYMSYRHTIVHEALDQLGKTLDDYDSQRDLALDMHKYFGYLHNVVRDLPLMIETEDFIFVHAGINPQNYMETPRYDALNMPYFYRQSHNTNKIVVVGHFPTSNFVEGGLMDNNIKYNEQMRIIDIDGGNQVKYSGQLNALIIQYEDDDYQLETTFVDGYPRREVIQSFEVAYQTPHTFTYPHLEIEIGEGDEYFTQAKHIQTGIEFMVKTEFILSTDSGYRLKDDYTDYFMDVIAGEEVAVIDDRYLGYTLVMKDGVTGWVPEEVL
ncbi:metallophosphoesterase [Macrococcoides caseolyticum]|uniref:metallophosphoesterase n=1 Tax=Macrococcoides caseolyticum TaxID=69966 RepID=UPI001F426393|nr:metallophosphoesterase [Macrococcus caseolyticus]MCE4956439.1 metallophosphoesterase [Macrococcus caseolyticus]